MSIKRRISWHPMKTNFTKRLHKYYIKKDYKSLDQLLSKVAPQTLIKFCSGKYEDKEETNNVYLNSLIKSELWLSSPSTFNDPFDAFYNLDYETHAKQSFNYIAKVHYGRKIPKIANQTALRELLNKFESITRNSFTNILQCSYVACFAEKDNLSSCRMWGYYANCHKGFCVEYDFNALSKLKILPILYTDMYTILNGAGSNVRELSLKLFYNKSKEWEYEKEWRVVASEPIATNQIGRTTIIDKPKAIYLGCLASKKLINDVSKICVEQEIELYQMQMIKNSFALKPVKIEINRKE